MTTTLPSQVLAQVLAGFDETGVCWALLRGRRLLGEPGHDVDLLLDETDLAAAEEVVLALGGVPLPSSLHPWHHFYLLDEPAGPPLKLDVVTRVVYHRGLRLRTGLEGPLLDRRRHDGTVHVLHPADRFWTVLLHCLLDKQAFTQRRRDELLDALPSATEDSPGRRWLETLCPPGWSADRTVDLVRRQDWDALVELGRDVAAAAGAGDRPSSGWTADRSAGRPGLRRRLRTRLAPAYPWLWRTAGLGAEPRLLEVAEHAGVDLVVVGLRRRPPVRDVRAVVAAGSEPVLAAALRGAGYRRVRGVWTRPTATGLERVHVQGDTEWSEWSAAWGRSRPVYRRPHCRRAA